MEEPLKFTVRWSFEAEIDLAGIYEYIETDSTKNAEKVIDTLLKLGDSLVTFPEAHPQEWLLENDKRTYRFIPKWNYKIIFTVNNDKQLVTIARVFSTRQHPDKLKI